jgi:hypothetical protein
LPLETKTEKPKQTPKMLKGTPVKFSTFSSVTPSRSVTPAKAAAQNEQAIKELALAQSLALELEKARDDPTIGIDKIEELASRAWEANVLVEKRQIQVLCVFPNTPSSLPEKAKSWSDA